MRGEDFDVFLVRWLHQETPPRAWGRLRVVHRLPRPRGNTPTCVGKTSLAASRPLALGKHPHVRGEDHTALQQRGVLLETPPRAWGRPWCGPARTAPPGNTPTCVGKTLEHQHHRRVREKHPHVRGEDRANRLRAGARRETPPRAWGRPQHPALGQRAGRNTPTCVGKTLSIAALLGIATETPPRAWGRRSRHPPPIHRGRNTPTCVGKTDGCVGSPRARRKHPHVRGEDTCACTPMAPQSETPPRAWGRRHRWQRQRDAAGNTPTCVGKTSESDWRPWVARKHPHVRGEDDYKREAQHFAPETPPRAWGRPARPGCGRCCAGNTPTCVGKTGTECRQVADKWKHPHVRGEDQDKTRNTWEP